jgi:hypothetical protein
MAMLITAFFFSVRTDRRDKIRAVEEKETSNVSFNTFCPLRNASRPISYRKQTHKTGRMSLLFVPMPLADAAQDESAQSQRAYRDISSHLPRIPKRAHGKVTVKPGLPGKMRHPGPPFFLASMKFFVRQIVFVNARVWDFSRLR